MGMTVGPAQLDIYRTSIPMRGFEHAAAARELAEAIVVRLELADGTVGWGETLPREYVTGETLESVAGDIENILWPAALVGDPEGKYLPAADGERPITAACCAVALAMYDAARHAVNPYVGSVKVQERPFPPVRVSGVLGSSDPARTVRQLRRMRWFGMRHFKLKLGLGEELDAENLRVVARRIGKAVRKGRCSLRVDVNGAWPADQTPDRVAALVGCGVEAVEQPTRCDAAAFAELARRCKLPLVADESMVTLADAETLCRDGGSNVWLNVRLSKNGGIWHCLGIIEAAADASVPMGIGCMVGESAILSAAQRRLLSLAPMPRFVEGNYGKFLLADDLAARRVRFGYAGRLKRLAAPGLGVVVDAEKLARYGRCIRTLHA